MTCSTINSLPKHDNAETGTRVSNRDPKLFWMHNKPTGRHRRDARWLSDAKVFESIEVVRWSGPTLL